MSDSFPIIDGIPHLHIILSISCRSRLSRIGVHLTDIISECSMPPLPFPTFQKYKYDEHAQSKINLAITTFDLTPFIKNCNIFDLCQQGRDRKAKLNDTRTASPKPQELTTRASTNFTTRTLLPSDFCHQGLSPSCRAFPSRKAGVCINTLRRHGVDQVISRP